MIIYPAFLCPSPLVSLAAALRAAARRRALRARRLSIPPPAVMRKAHDGQLCPFLWRVYPPPAVMRKAHVGQLCCSLSSCFL
jgi:hypothetical protein